jgi:hypothetical protein
MNLSKAGSTFLFQEAVVKVMQHYIKYELLSCKRYNEVVIS